MTIDIMQWDRQFVLLDGLAVHVRPIRPGDEAYYDAFFRAEEAEDLRYRFFGQIKPTRALYKALAHIDYASAMAFIALDETDREMLGVARLHDDPDVPDEAEFAIIIRSDMKSHGLGWQLMKLIVGYAQAKGLCAITGEVLRANTAMIDMCRELGFESHSETDASYIADMRLNLLPLEHGRAVVLC